MKDNADAEFVCAGLISVGFDTELPPEESFKLLLKASAQHHIQAMIEAGLCYFSGRGVEKNKEKAVELWSRAAAMGSREAQIRLTTTNVIADLHLRDYAASIPDLDSAAHKGSLLAQVALAYCYETGTGVVQSKAGSGAVVPRERIQGKSNSVLCSEKNVRRASSGFSAIPD